MVLELLFGKKESPYDSFNSLKGVERYSERHAAKKIRKLSGMGWEGENARLLKEPPVIQMIPHNTGMPTCPFVWYAKSSGNYFPALTNRNDFTKEISNLPKILDKTADVMLEAYNVKVPISTLNFGFKLTSILYKREPYHGEGEFVFIDADFFTKKAKQDPIDLANGMLNHYLDIFMGWNFGDIIKDNPELEKKLLGLNTHLIQDKTRNLERPMGFEVCFRGDEDCFFNFSRE